MTGRGRQGSGCPDEKTQMGGGIRSISVDAESTSTEDGSLRFGVRSYLHHFYEDCAGAAFCKRQQQQLVQDDKVEKRRKRKRLMLCVTCVIGLLLVLAGLTVFVTSLVTSNGWENKSKDESGLSTWGSGQLLICGAAVFCAGGVVVSICTVLISLGVLEMKKEMMEAEIFQERLWRGRTSFHLEPSTPHNYDVTAVQPLVQDAKGVEMPQQSGSTTVSSH